MRFLTSILGLVLAIILAGGWGCSKAKTKTQQDAEQAQALQAKAEAEQARIAKVRAEFEGLMMRVDQLQQEDKKAEAMAILEGALANKELSEYQVVIFQRLLFANLASEQIEAAQTRYRGMRRDNPTVARQCQGIVEGHLFERQQFAGLEEWVTSLMLDETDEGTVAALARWQFRAVRAQGKANAAVSVLTPLGTRLTPAVWRGLAGEFGSALIQEGVADDAGQLIEFLGGKEASDPEMASLRITLRLALWISRQEWDPAVEFLKGLEGQLADAPFSGYFNQVADPLRRAQKNEKLTALCKWALYELKGKPVVRETAAQLYIRNSVEIEQVGLTLDRINELKQAGFDASHVARWMDQVYSVAMKKGENKDFESLLTMGQEVLPGLKEPRDQANVAGIILDVSFRLDRFTAALAVLEKGVSGQDKAWHESMINKVKAHLDVQEGRPLEAAQKFIQFLNESAAKMEPTIDPISGDLIIREMVQGLNAKRIADLMKKGGNDAEAAVYYLKAREYYTQALKKIDSQSSRVQVIEAELAALPQ